jgi:hypothetical protein
MPAAARPARPHCIVPARNLETLTIFSNFQFAFLKMADIQDIHLGL